MARDDSIRDASEKYGFLGPDFRVARVEAEEMYQPLDDVEILDLAKDASGGDVTIDFTSFSNIYPTSSNKVVTVVKEIEFILQVPDAWEWDKFADFGNPLTDGIQLSRTIEGSSYNFGPVIKTNSDLLKFVKGDNFDYDHLEDQDGTTVLGYIRARYEFEDPMVLIYDSTTEDKFTVTIKGSTDNLTSLADAILVIRGNDYVARS